jgi:membrane-associated HD superfamily phosphohydrolase
LSSLNSLNSLRSLSGLKRGVTILFVGLLLSLELGAQCSVCTKTAQQLGEKPAEGMNTGILYLAFMPMAIIGFLAYKWWKSNQSGDQSPA